MISVPTASLDPSSLEPSEEQLRDLFEHTSDLIQSVALDGRFLFVNPAWCRTLGYDSSDLATRSLFEILDPSSLGQFQAAVQRLVAGENTGPLETVFRTRDGRPIFTEGTLSLQTTDGEPVATRGIFRDVTARRSPEVDARLLALVAEHTTNIVVITDASARVEWANPAFTRLSGYTLDEVRGRTPGSILQGPETNRVTVAFMRNRRQAGQGFRTQLLNYAKDGRTYWLEIDVQPVRDSSGRPVKFIAIETDITARKAAEAELIGYKSRLELALKAANTCTWESDVARNLLRLDARWSLMLGGKAQSIELSAGAAIRGVHPDDRAETLRHYRDCYAGPTAMYRIEQRVRTFNGDWIWILSAGRVVARDANGRATRLIGTNTDITVQKRNAETLERLNTQLEQMVAERTMQLSESERRYRHLIGLLPVAVYTCDAHGQLTYYNEQAHRMWGRRPAVLDPATRYCGAFRLWLPDGSPLPHDRTPMAEAIRDGRSFRNVEVIIEQPDGQRVHAMANIDPLRDESGAIFGAINSLSDVTGRKLAEAALRESEQRFRSVFDHSPVTIALVTLPGGRFVEVNPATEATFGFSRAELLGRTTNELGVWADHADRDRFVAALARDGAVRSFETRMRRRNGEVFAALFSASVVTIGEQKFSLNLVQDITARIESEQARERSLSLMRATLESAADGILVVNGSGHIETFNRNFAELWRLPAATPGTMTEDSILQAVLGQLESPEKFLESIRQLYLNSTEDIFDVLHAKDGRVFERYSRPQLVNGESVGRVWSFREITARLLAEQERAQLAETLRHSQKIESLGTLAGGIAHDFNNILTGLFGFLELTRDELPRHHPAQEFVSASLQTGHRAKELVRQILTFGRRNEGERKPLQLAVPVSEALGLLRSTLPAMVELRAHIAPGCPPVEADGTQIHQIVMNLCTNAWHALPARGGLIEVSVAPCTFTPALALAHPRVATGPAVRLVVTDHGCGMDATTLARIFEPFFTTKEDGKGTGLGLAVVHGIVESHKGAIGVKSTPGIGTTFEIYLPAILSTRPAGETDVAPAVVAPTGHGEHVLLVDDDVDSGRALERTLITLGYRVTRVTDARAALNRLLNAPHDFASVVTDLAMPAMSGGELAEELHAKLPGLPVILISGLVEAQQEARLLQAGVREVLRKPPSRADLSRAIARHCRAVPLQAGACIQ